MVLYNGQTPWRVPLNIGEVIDGGIIPERYLLQGNYYLLDENRVTEQRLSELHNLAAAVIYYEKHRRSDDMRSALMKMMDLLTNEYFDEIRQVILWAFRITGRKFDEKEIKELQTLKEGKEYMDTVTSQWEINIRNKALQEGRLEGRQEGRQEGLKQGEEKTLHSVARSMKLKGLEASLISELTGLSEEEILAIDLK